MLATIGYEGTTLEDFVAALQAAQVTVLLDIREARSRAAKASRSAN